ncbi:MAG: pilus assembly protein CpaE [Actinomycetota bacterium]|nr:pilus assembly protein CpaE [Actinomycetota bacterium]
MSQEYLNNRRVPHSTLSNYNLDTEEQDLDADDAFDAPLKLLVVDRRGSFSSDIERAARALEYAPTVVTVSRLTGLLEEVRLESPDVVLAAPEEMTVTGLRRLAQIHRASPKTVIVLTQGATPISMTEAASCGAGEVIAYPASTTRLRNALHRILETAEAVRGERVVIREVPAAAPEHAPASAARARVSNAMVFTVTSPTGGCGKTFFATNLAAYLAGVTGGRVLLVDLDLQFGEVSLALGLRPQRTISELINEEDMDEALPEYLMEHSSGYQVLSAPADPFAAELVGPREATRVLECARRHFDYIVVDTPPSLNEVVLAAYDQSRYLVVMATLDVPSLRNLRVFLETIERLKLPAEDVSCVLNKAEPDNGIDLQELLRVYPRGFAAVLPYAREVSRSLNAGQPVLIIEPRAEISQKLLEAGAKLVPASQVINPTWGARPAGRVSWSARRKERQAQLATATPTHTAAAVHYEAPSAAEWPQAGSSVEPPAARVPDETVLREPFVEDKGPLVRAPGHGPAWATTQRRPASAAAPNGNMAGGHSGRTDRAPVAAGLRDNGLTRFRLRIGARLWGPGLEASQAQQGALPSLATQMQVGPPSLSGPLRGPSGSLSGPLSDPDSSSEPLKRPSSSFGPTAASSPLVFSGSRQAASPLQRPQSRRERPTETPKTNRKEPRR